MARLTSTPTTLTVTNPTTGMTLRAASQAAGFSSNQFLPYAGNGLSVRTQHPGGPRGGYSCDVTEDGSQHDGHTCIDWGAKGCYDPVSRKVMWASCGAGNNLAGGYVYNTHAIFDEASISWSALRGFRGANETTSAAPIVHLYDGNAIDVAGRRFYRKKFAREVMVYNLDTGAWLDNITYSSGEPSSYGWDGGLEWIPSRARLWIRSISAGDNSSSLHELNPANGVITTLFTGGQIGQDSAASVCSFNPRAFGNAGGVFIGGSSAITVDLTGGRLSLITNTSGKPAGKFLWPNGAHVCRDPVGDGWLFASDDGFMYRLSSAGVWSQRAQLPVELRNGSTWNWVMVPIDEYGVVWIITNQGIGPDRAWLYKP